MQQVLGTVYLVGAGPGNPDLITVRGLECLRRAQVVVYDRLVSRSLLAETAPESELIYVGKEGGGFHTLPQAAISQLLVDKARAGLTVCRLKGGDPFVFGRGGEEAIALRRAGIPFEVVPGVTAGVGVPTFAGIPLTHRGMASTVVFVTGHEAAELRSGTDWAGLAASSATLVCYMGLGRLAEVRDELLRYGRPADTPAAVIHWGTRAEQRVVIGTLDDLPERARELAQPAIVVIGQVVDLREVMDWAEQRPLFGRRVLLPAPLEEPAEAAAELAMAVRDRGGEPWVFPRRPEAPAWREVELLRQELSTGGIHLAVVTSPSAAHFLFHTLGESASLLHEVPFLCKTPETAAALARYDVRVQVAGDLGGLLGDSALLNGLAAGGRR